MSSKGDAVHKRLARILLSVGRSSRAQEADMMAFVRLLSDMTGVEIDADMLRPILILSLSGLLLSLLWILCDPSDFSNWIPPT